MALVGQFLQRKMTGRGDRMHSTGLKTSNYKAEGGVWHGETLGSAGQRIGKKSKADGVNCMAEESGAEIVEVTAGQCADWNGD